MNLIIVITCIGIVIHFCIDIKILRKENTYSDFVYNLREVANQCVIIDI